MALKYTDEEIMAALAEHGSCRAAARALGANPATIYARAKKLPDLRGLTGDGAGLARYSRLRLGQLTQRALARLGEMLEADDQKLQLSACRLVLSAAQSGALAAPARAAVEDRDPEPAAPWETLCTLATAQASPDEIAASIAVDHGWEHDRAVAYCEEHAQTITVRGQAGRAQLRARALAQSTDNPTMTAELARQHAFWARGGFADEVRTTVERAERKH